jgi:hypothetical protein
VSPETAAAERAPTLDEAWDEAELALGEWWRIRSLTALGLNAWEAVATDGRRIRIGRGPTPRLALLDLAGNSR